MNTEEKQPTALVPIDPEVQKALVPKTAGYWERVAGHYTVCFRALLILLVVFCVLFTILFSKVFTYDSVLCFFRDLQSVSSFVSDGYSTVTSTYMEGEQTVLPYRGGIAFVGTGGIEIYSPGGERLLNVERRLSAPRAVASRKYLVAYDHCGTQFYVTNSYAELYRGETEFPIYGAFVSDSGHFALITASDQTLSQVLLYDGNFNLIQRFNRSSATVGVAVSDNGKRIAILGATAEQGTVATRVDLFQRGALSAEASFVFFGEVPLSVEFTVDRNVVVLTDAALRVCDINGKVRNELSAKEGDAVALDVSDRGAVLAMETDKITGAHRVLAVDKRGDVLYDDTFSVDVLAVAMGDGEIFLLTPDRVYRVDTDTGEVTEQQIDEGATDLFVVGAGQVRVCYTAKADMLFFE